MITRFLPGHDSRLLSKAALGLPDSVNISLSFSQLMYCKSVTKSIEVQSETDNGITPNLRPYSVECSREMGNEKVTYNG
jgi:alpha-1,3-glucan synthase